VPRIRYFREPTRSKRANFLVARDQFRERGLELFYDYAQQTFEVRRGPLVVAWCGSLQEAKAWLGRA